MALTTLPTAPVAGGSLALGYLVAAGSGVRPLGGLVLLAGAGWCGRRWLRVAGPAVTGTLVGCYAAAFAGSHVLAKAIGAWPSVAVVSTATAAAAWALADRRALAAAAAPLSTGAALAAPGAGS